MRRFPSTPRLSLVALLLLTGCSHRTPGETDLFNQQAALPSGLPVAALEGRAISSSVDRLQHTMSTLTGNDIAVVSARAANGSAAAASGSPYPEGSVLTLATWNQRDDPHWFGARIPGPPKTVETVSILRASNGQLTTSYQIFAGDPLHRIPDGDAAQARARQEYILAQHASIMP
jgi:hypothetical protein